MILLVVRRGTVGEVHRELHRELCFLPATSSRIGA